MIKNVMEGFSEVWKTDLKYIMVAWLTKKKKKEKIELHDQGTAYSNALKWKEELGGGGHLNFFKGQYCYIIAHYIQGLDKSEST